LARPIRYLGPCCPSPRGDRMKITITEKGAALFRRVKGLPDDEIEWAAEIAALEADMKRGLCPQCCFADCRCVRGEPIT